MKKQKRLWILILVLLLCVVLLFSPEAMRLCGRTVLSVIGTA